jgi:4-hydroxy-tetrahydrodipicolinate synthase
MKRTILFQGTGTAIVTPFTERGEVDIRAFKKLVDRQIAEGVEAIIPAGTTGESVTLSESEHLQIVRTVVERGKSKIKIIAGAGTNSTSKTITLARRVIAEGADAILTVTPYYNKPTQEGLYQHYAAIASAIEAPIILYNVPGRTACTMDVATMLRLADEFPHIAGVKEASGNLAGIMDILRRRPKGFGVWSGDDALTLPLMALGADGVISVVSNEVPKEFSKMVRFCLQGRFNEALKIHNALLNIMQFNFIESSPIPVKAVLAEMGLIGEYYRLPLVKMSTKHIPAMKNIIKELKIK